MEKVVKKKVLPNGNHSNVLVLVKDSIYVVVLSVSSYLSNLML